MKMYSTIFSLTSKVNSLIKCKWETNLEQAFLEFSQEKCSKVYELDIQYGAAELISPYIFVQWMEYCSTGNYENGGFLYHLCMLKVK